MSLATFCPFYQNEYDLHVIFFFFNIYVGCLSQVSWWGRDTKFFMWVMLMIWFTWDTC